MHVGADCSNVHMMGIANFSEAKDSISNKQKCQYAIALLQKVLATPTKNI